MADKIITFGVPCYNSSDYMDHCISSILEGSDFADDVQVVIVDDGSTKDDTPERADRWAERYPDNVKVVHQENGGHGIAVLSAIAQADGTYFKIVDSDDWLSAGALRALLFQIRRFLREGTRVDLIVTNYVFEHVVDGKQNVVDFHIAIPRGKVITWDQIGVFNPAQYLMMHSLCYRTDVLRAGGVPMPAHTFYVDNIYAYVPLPRVKTLFYLDVDLYRYYIGREDQSVNEDVVVKRLDQQFLVTRIMMRAYHLYDEIEITKLRNYMMDYLTLMMASSSVYARLSKKQANVDAMDDLWDELEEFDERMYRSARNGAFGIATNLPTKTGQTISVGIYKAASKLFKFN
jgi:glycosyltransferase involved in cell wall biosynthesis